MKLSSAYSVRPAASFSSRERLGSGRLRSLRPNLEQLEDRLAPAVLLWQNDNFFNTFGPSQAITIGAGFLDPPFTAADIYIVPSSSPRLTCRLQLHA
jgi:hypothetical protein